METKLTLIQKPVIQHAIEEISLEVEEKLKDANIPNLIASSESIKSLKDLRANFNSMKTELENQRIALKKAVAAPYMEVEELYKEKVLNKLKDGIDTLGKTISSFETKAKEERREKIASYFAELCLDYDVDFIELKDVGLNITLSPSLKSYKEKCAAFVQKISDDMALIKTLDHEAEITVEFKKTLNASKAITDVNQRKQEEKLAKEKILQERTSKRESMLRAIAMVHHDMANAFAYVSDDEISISDYDITGLSDEDFNREFVKMELAIKAKQPAVEEKPKIATPLKAPTVVNPEVAKAAKIVKAKFEATGTIAQLKALGQYMKDNNITYKNI